MSSPLKYPWDRKSYAPLDGVERSSYQDKPTDVGAAQSSNMQ